MIEREGRKEREIQNRDAQRGHALRVNPVIATPGKFATAERQESRDHAQDNAAGFADPLIVDGVLEEECSGQNERHGRDAVDPNEPDVCLKFSWRVRV